MEAQTCQVMRWLIVWSNEKQHNSFQTVDDSHPTLDDRFVPVQKDFWSDSVGVSCGDQQKDHTWPT